jgi:AcrR family transcriptional regulator
VTRTRARLISPEEAIERALDIVDTEGLDALNMRKLAGALGVRGPSLYHHFQDKEAILDGIAQLVLAGVRIPEDDEPDWREWLVQVMGSYRSALLAHPSVVPLMINRRNRTVGLAVYDYATRKMQEAGIPAELHLSIVNTVEAFALGSVLLSLPGTAGGFPDLPRRGYDHLRAAIRANDPDPESSFEQSSRALIDDLVGRARPSRRRSR